MSNAPKTGFFQTIPGLITATAGFLSAATGAIVALNQTGVVDLKKLTGNKPPEQVAPLNSPGAATIGSGANNPGVSTAPTTSVAQNKAAEPGPAATTSTGAPPSQPAPSVTTPTPPAETKTAAALSSPTTAPNKVAEPPPSSIADAKPQIPPATQPSAGPTDAEKMKAIQEGAASAKKVEPSPPTTTGAPIKPAEASPPPKVADSAGQPVKPAPTREFEKPVSPPVTKPVETAPIVKAPPPPPEKQKNAAEPAPSRVAENKPADRPPTDDPARAKIVRPPSTEAVASRTGGKKRVDGVEPGGARPTSAPPKEIASTGGPRMLDLAGLKMTVPPGWVKEEVQQGPMAPVAALRIPDPAGDGSVQITRVLGAHGKDMEDRTIERWLGQVTKANGAPSAMGDARIERRQIGTIRVTTVDLAGTVKATPRESGIPGGRMVAAIIDHPAGPHLITIVGPSKSMAKWDAAIDGFLRSVTPE